MIHIISLTQLIKQEKNQRLNTYSNNFVWGLIYNIILHKRRPSLERSVSRFFLDTHFVHQHRHCGCWCIFISYLLCPPTATLWMLIYFYILSNFSTFIACHASTDIVDNILVHCITHFVHIHCRSCFHRHYRRSLLLHVSDIIWISYLFADII